MNDWNGMLNGENIAAAAKACEPNLSVTMQRRCDIFQATVRSAF